MVITKLANIEALSKSDIDRLYSLMVHAYEVTEVEIWGEKYVRMSYEEFISLIEKQEIILAELENEIVGSIHVSPLFEKCFGFGLLSADFEKKGQGIGRALINAAENHAIDSGATHMQLEILRPKSFEVPNKTVLRDWYLRQGYVFLESILFEERKPEKAEKAKNFKVPCVFDCYEKVLIKS